MKKFFAMVLMLCLLCGATALADNSNRQTELKSTVDSGYTIVIPATLEIVYGAEASNLAVQVTELHLSSKYNALKVEVGSMNPLKNENEQLIWYTIDGKSFGATRYFQTPETQNFVVGIAAADWNKAAAGSYSGTVSFNTSFDNVSND